MGTQKLALDFGFLYPVPMSNSENILSLKSFSYEFPQELVAQVPLEKRDQSKLLIRSTNSTFLHSKFENLSEHLGPKTLLVLNDTKVFASRLFGKLESGKTVEIFLLAKPGIQCEVEEVPCFVKPARKVEEGERIYLSEGSFLKVLRKPEKGNMDALLLDFSNAAKDLSNWLSENAYVPLPPYIKRENPLAWSQSEDSQRYQTVYANWEGSVAAPTAGLHFTKNVLERLAQKGIETCSITLHVSAGTFLPVKSEDINEHRMHKEKYYLSSASWAKIQEAKKSGHSIIAVGTTSFRTLESFLRNGSKESDLDSWLETDLFIHPTLKTDRYRSEIFNGILTNFHQPCSTLFMLVCALIGFDEAHSLYKEAVSQKYRLFSYGDSSLLWF